MTLRPLKYTVTIKGVDTPFDYRFLEDALHCIRLAMPCEATIKVTNDND